MATCLGVASSRRGACSARPAKASQAAVVHALEREPLLERVARGDQEAVKKCLDAYGNLVRSIARRFLSNAADAEEAVQDVFVSVWSSAASYDSAIASESSFISTIARRRAIDRLREMRRRPATLVLEEWQEPNVPGAIEDAAAVGEVEAVLDSLEPKYRDTVVLSQFAGYSHSEIADRLNLPLGTIKTHIRRGLLQIREQLTH